MAFTVEELIAELEEYDPDMPVKISTRKTGWDLDIVMVDLEEDDLEPDSVPFVTVVS